MKIFKVIVAGSRDFNNYNLLKNKLDKLLINKLPDVVIVSGGARGADKLGERYAEEKGLACKIYLADWDLYGKSAGYKRNIVMADNADGLVAFWNEQSKGTRHMINIARNKKLFIRIIKYKEQWIMSIKSKIKKLMKKRLEDEMQLVKVRIMTETMKQLEEEINNKIGDIAADTALDVFDYHNARDNHNELIIKMRPIKSWENDE